MAEEDDEDDAISMALHGTRQDEATHGGFLQVRKAQERRTGSSSSMDDYVKESEDGLSAALG